MTHYLTTDPHLFVAEERMLQYGSDANQKVWYIDAVAVDPWQKTFFLAEATYNPSPAPLMRKIKLFYEVKNEVMTRLSLEGLATGWDVRPWLFVRREAIPFVKLKLPDDCFPKITHLEETAFPWIYEAVRRNGKEPNKPYPDLDERYQV